MKVLFLSIAGIFGQQEMTMKGDYGQFLECPYGYVMNGFCSSGNKKDCDRDGKSYSHMIQCVENTRLSLDITSRCCSIQFQNCRD